MKFVLGEVRKAIRFCVDDLKVEVIVFTCGERRVWKGEEEGKHVKNCLAHLRGISIRLKNSMFWRKKHFSCRHALFNKEQEMRFSE